jgi:hypothetical protein
MNKPFTTITLSNGDVCDIFEPIASHMMKAQKEQVETVRSNPKMDELGPAPFFIRQVITINSNRPSLQYVTGMAIDDYLAINDVITILFKKFA